MKVKSESEGGQSCPTLCDPMDCSLPGFSILGIFQARVLDWGAIAFSEEMATHPSIIDWEIPWTEEPGMLQSLGSQESDRTGHTHTYCIKCSTFNNQGRTTGTAPGRKGSPSLGAGDEALPIGLEFGQVTCCSQWCTWGHEVIRSFTRAVCLASKGFLPTVVDIMVI